MVPEQLKLPQEKGWLNQMDLIQFLRTVEKSFGLDMAKGLLPHNKIIWYLIGLQL